MPTKMMKQLMKTLGLKREKVRLYLNLGIASSTKHPNMTILSKPASNWVGLLNISESVGPKNAINMP